MRHRRRRRPHRPEQRWAERSVLVVLVVFHCAVTARRRCVDAGLWRSDTRLRQRNAGVRLIGMRWSRHTLTIRNSRGRGVMICICLRLSWWVGHGHSDQRGVGATATVAGGRVNVKSATAATDRGRERRGVRQLMRRHPHARQRRTQRVRRGRWPWRTPCRWVELEADCGFGYNLSLSLSPTYGHDLPRRVRGQGQAEHVDDI